MLFEYSPTPADSGFTRRRIAAKERRERKYKTYVFFVVYLTESL